MSETKLRILNKVKKLGIGYFCFHCEIPPYGPGTRRYVLGKEIDPIPFSDRKKNEVKQEYLTDPLPALKFEKKVDEYRRNQKNI